MVPFLIIPSFLENSFAFVLFSYIEMVFRGSVILNDLKAFFIGFCFDLDFDLIFDNDFLFANFYLFFSFHSFLSNCLYFKQEFEIEFTLFFFKWIFVRRMGLAFFIWERSIWETGFSFRLLEREAIYLVISWFITLLIF